MRKLLRQKTSGHIYVWTEGLAKRDDMEPYEEAPVFKFPYEITAVGELTVEPKDSDRLSQEQAQQIAQTLVRRRGRPRKVA